MPEFSDTNQDAPLSPSEQEIVANLREQSHGGPPNKKQSKSRSQTQQVTPKQTSQNAPISQQDKEMVEQLRKQTTAQRGSTITEDARKVDVRGADFVSGERVASRVGRDVTFITEQDPVRAGRFAETTTSELARGVPGLDRQEATRVMGALEENIRENRALRSTERGGGRGSGELAGGLFETPARDSQRQTRRRQDAGDRAPDLSPF